MVAFVGSAAASAAIVAAVRRIAWERAWLDVPTPRSSHERPTPTAGGIGVVVPIVLALALLPQALPAGTVAVCAAAVMAAAAVGLADDLMGLAAESRFVVHVLAGLAIGLTAGASVTAWTGWAAALAIAGWTLGAAASINVVNFMDGIDGLIGTTALVFGLFSAVAIGVPHPDASAALVLAGASLGFLLFNRPPASIFLGDVGSGGIGAGFVVLGLLTLAARDWSLIHAFLPLAPLVLDEGITMAGRIARGERLTEAHRSHVYQILAGAGWGHGRVTLLYGSVSALLAAVALSLPARSPTFGVIAGGAVLVTAGGLMLLRRNALRATAGRIGPDVGPRGAE